MVAVDAILHVLHARRGRDLDFLIVGKHGGAGGDVLLALVAEDGGENLQHGVLLGLVLLHALRHRQLAHRIGQQPVVVAGFAEVGQHHVVRAVLRRDDVRHRRRVAEHGRLTGAEGLRDHGELQLVVAGLNAHVLEELLVLLKHPRPDHLVQANLIVLRLALVLHAPLGALQAHQLRNGAPLHGLQTRVVVVPVGLIALDAFFLEGVDGRHELGVVGGQRNAVLVEQILVGHGAVHLGAHGQPADRAVGLAVDLQVAGIEDARHLSLAQVHQVLRQRRRIVQREAAAGDDVRHRLATGHQILIILHAVVALHKGEIDVRELLLQPGRQLLEHGTVPHVHGNGDPVALRALVGVRLLGSASGQHRSDQNGDQQQAGNSLAHLHSPLCSWICPCAESAPGGVGIPESVCRVLKPPASACPVSVRGRRAGLCSRPFNC